MTTPAIKSLQVIFKVQSVTFPEPSDYCREPSPYLDMANTAAWANEWLKDLTRRHPCSTFTFTVEAWF